MRTFASFLFLFAFLCCSIIPVIGSAQSGPLSDEKPNQCFQETATGFYNVTTFTPLTFNGDVFHGFQTICGYKVIPHLAIGGGIGYERFGSIPTYDDFKTNLMMLPVFIDIRYTVLNRKVSPVIVLNAGYKILLNKPSSQVVYDTAYHTVITVSGRSDYADYDIYRNGGPFITAGIGVKLRLYRRLSAYCSAEYSLWSVSGNRYSSDRSWLMGNNGWALVNSTETTSRTMTYVHVFQIRLGIVF